MDITELKRRPTTPGEVLREEFLEPLKESIGLTQKKLADHIDVDIKVINRLVNNRTSIMPELAFKLAYAFGTSPEFWLNLQKNVDLYDAYNANKKELKKIQKVS